MKNLNMELAASGPSFTPVVSIRTFLCNHLLNSTHCFGFGFNVLNSFQRIEECLPGHRG